MSHYRSDLRDLEFNLFEVFDIARFLGTELDRDTVRQLLHEVDRLAADRLAPSWRDADRPGPAFDPRTGEVMLPEPLRRAYEAYVDAGFWRLDLPAELGGSPAPRLLWWAIAELTLAANPALMMYAMAHALARALHAEGTPEQRAWAELFVRRRWAATMVLTEPDAGSDVGAARTVAHPQDDGSWHIEGVKRFISCGEHDLTDNIIHLVLARPAGGEPGTKGLSLYVVPKFLFDPATGALTGRNGVYATNLERKMGLRASATCELTFGAEAPARGWLVGGAHDGIRQMFLIIQYFRMIVGVKAAATLSTGFRNALEYARSRVQGADLLQAHDPAAPRIAIIGHPDVRRSLLVQKAYAEGLRALYLYAARWQDEASTATGDHALAGRVADLLLPIVKGCGSERAYRILGEECLQTFGGSGYLQDYPVEQYVRDAKVDTLYEGTTAIQGLDLFFRKIVKDGGIAVTTVLDEVRAFAEQGNGPLKDARCALADAHNEVRAALDAMLGFQRAERRALYKIGLQSRRLLLAVGDLIIGWLLQRQAEVALAALDRAEVSASDEAFYRGKGAVARFFAAEVLPRLGADRAVIERAGLDVMDLPDESF